MKKGLRRNRFVHFTSPHVADSERSPDEEGVETNSSSFDEHGSRCSERSPDEEGVETVERLLFLFECSFF